MRRTTAQMGYRQQPDLHNTVDTVSATTHTSHIHLRRSFPRMHSLPLSRCRAPRKCKRLGNAELCNSALNSAVLHRIPCGADWTGSREVIVAAGCKLQRRSSASVREMGTRCAAVQRKRAKSQRKRTFLVQYQKRNMVHWRSYTLGPHPVVTTTALVFSQLTRE